MAFKCMEEYWIFNRWQMIQDANVSQHPALDLLESTKSLARSMEERWTLNINLESAPTTKDLEGPLKTLWYMTILAVQRCDDAETIGSIVEFLKGLKALGPLQRFITADGKPLPLTEPQSAGLSLTRQHHRDVAGSAKEEAQSLDGKLWADLPLLQHALLDRFLKKPPVTPKETWTSMHTFVARLTANDVQDLSFFGIWALFDALETYKHLRVEKTGQTSLLDLLPSVMIWLKHCGEIIFTHCRNNHVPGDLAASRGFEWYQAGPPYVGWLAREAGIDTPGFSIKRWKFWRIRLHEIAVVAEEEPAKTDDVNQVFTMAKMSLERMGQLDGTVDH